VKIYKTVLLILVSIFLISTVFANGNQEKTSGKVERPKLKVYLLSEDSNRLTLHQDYYQPKVAAQFPDFDVEFELPGNAYTQKLKVYNASGDLPDVFWGADFIVNSDNALKLTDYIMKDGFYDKFKNKNGLIPFNDEYYSISPGQDAYFSSVLWYRKSIFADNGIAIPTSYEELLNVTNKFNKLGIIPISNQSWPLANFMFQDLIEYEDANFMKELIKGNAKFTDSVALEAAKKLELLVKSGAFSKDLAVIDYQSHVDLFTSGKAAMLYHPLWIQASIAEVSDDVGFLDLTSMSPKTNVLTGWGSPFNGFMISQNSRYKNEAVKLAEWMVTQDADYFSKVQNMPVSYDNGVVISGMSEATAAYAKMFEDKNVSTIPNMTQVLFNEAVRAENDVNMGKLVTGQITAEEYVNLLQKSIEEYK
jgi:raffinose/stachyose/melibiose transport system substrate-binding protein